MKKCWIKRCGKQGRINLAANKILKVLYAEKEITKCEICGSDWALSWHHKHHRYYYKTVEELADFNTTLLLCPVCHNKYMPDSKETLELFNKLRKNAIL